MSDEDRKDDAAEEAEKVSAEKAAADDAEAGPDQERDEPETSKVDEPETSKVDEPETSKVDEPETSEPDEPDASKRDEAAPGPQAEARPGSSSGLITLVVAALAISVGAGLYFRSKGAPATRPSGVGGAIVDTLEQKGHVAGARSVREACKAESSCACRQATARAALDADLGTDALAALSGDEACKQEAASREMEAEGLARAGRCDEANARVAEITKQQVKAPFAHYALAHCAYAAGDVVRAGGEAGMAGEMGRGGPAHLLLGLIQYRAGNLRLAQIEFEKMLKLDPDDVEARYNLALIAQQQNRYREAREGYLRVLKLSPSHLDARFNLGLLTHSVGAVNEAKHNLEELERIAPPGDDRVTRLKAVLAGPTPPAGGQPVVAPPEFAPPGASGAALPGPSGGAPAAPRPAEVQPR